MGILDILSGYLRNLSFLVWFTETLGCEVTQPSTKSSINTGGVPRTWSHTSFLDRITITSRDGVEYPAICISLSLYFATLFGDTPTSDCSGALMLVFWRVCSTRFRRRWGEAFRNFLREALPYGLCDTLLWLLGLPYAHFSHSVHLYSYGFITAPFLEGFF